MSPVTPDAWGRSEGARDEGEGGGDSGWKRALGLFLFTVGASVVNPLVLMAVPFVLLVAVLPAKRAGLVAAGLVAVLFVVGSGPTEGMWYLERGWAVLVGGWFLGLSLRWPKSRFFPRALGAVGGAFAVAALLFRVQPGSWRTVDWLVTSRMRAQAAEIFSAFRLLGGGEGVSPELSDAVYRTVETQGVVFPALLGLASVAALGVAWWFWVRLGQEGRSGLLPLGEFRFNDQLVWIFVLGLALVLLGSSGPWDRLGTNTVVFMGALYALRGAGVLFFLNGGISLGGGLLLALAFVFVAPVMLGGAVVVGLGDTWLDLRTKARAAAESE
ncbi:MAG: DUF2232 domain-containing protein [Longimicrobiales bacterium]|nr:DUF2232 domain-containing protein [Longimicrobiales bacterium]